MEVFLNAWEEPPICRGLGQGQALIIPHYPWWCHPRTYVLYGSRIPLLVLRCLFLMMRIYGIFPIYGSWGFQLFSLVLMTNLKRSYPLSLPHFRLRNQRLKERMCVPKVLCPEEWVQDSHLELSHPPSISLLDSPTTSGQLISFSFKGILWLFNDTLWYIGEIGKLNCLRIRNPFPVFKIYEAAFLALWNLSHSSWGVQRLYKGNSVQISQILSAHVSPQQTVHGCLRGVSPTLSAERTFS